MSITTKSPASRNRYTTSLSTQILTAFTAGIWLFIAGVLGIVLLNQVVYLGRVYPGVSIAGIDLSGMRRTEVPAIIAETITYPDTGLILLKDGDRQWALTPKELGISLDPKATAEAAYKSGRRGWPWSRVFNRINNWRTGKSVSPEFIFDGQITQAALEKIAAEINQPVREARLTLNGIDVVAEAGQIGRTLDVWASTAVIARQITTMKDGEVNLVVIEIAPLILEVGNEAELARQILSEPLNLRIPNAGETDPGPWTFKPQELVNMLVLDRMQSEAGETYEVSLDTNELSALLASIASEARLNPHNSRFIFNDDTRELDIVSPAIIGRTLNLKGSIQTINEKITNGDHEIELVFDYQTPEVTDNTTAADLQITELISSQTTYFYGSSKERIQNIETGAAQFHGLFIAPGETFSMVEHLGDISLNSGYAESLIIFGDRTIAGVGGGICQVSTTLFRTVFFGGFPVAERYSHSYRVYYYELNSSGSQNDALAGLDATVYSPIVDFKFKNDSPYWILMETYVNPASRWITWKFYSTSESREVDWTTSGLQNVVKSPATLYEENSDLKKGKIEQVDWAVKGADVSISRTVTINGQIVFNDQFNTHYEPWRTICQYGPDTKDYPPEDKEGKSTKNCDR